MRYSVSDQSQVAEFTPWEAVLYITLACHRSIDEQIFSTPRPAIGVDDKSWSGPGRSHKFNNDLRSWFSPVGSLID